MLLRDLTRSVAQVHGGWTFHSDAFIGLQNMFRGVAWVKIEPPGDSEAERRVRRRRRNLLVRDQSPCPPRVRNGDSVMARVEGGWAPSLGKAGWIGIYSGKVNDPKNLDVDSEKEYYLAVVAGLDAVTYDDLDREINAYSGGEFTSASVFSPTGTFDIYRELAVENRRRLLALAVNAMQLKLMEGSLETHDSTYQFEQVRRKFGDRI